MFCKNCGNKIVNDSKFCGKCGSGIDNEVILNNKVFDTLEFKHSKGLFRGRISRLNLFLGMLLSLAPIFLIVTFWGIISVISNTFGKTSFVEVMGYIIPVLITLFVIFFIFFSISLLFRRCHDIDCSGWFSLLVLIPYIGIIPLIYFLFKKGNIKINEYGYPSKESRKFINDIFNY